jgi:hypothetical protein
MQYSCIKDSEIKNIIVCDAEMLEELNLDYNYYLVWERWHELGIKVIDGEFYKTEEIKDEEGNIINTINYKFNLELGEYEII